MGFRLDTANLGVYEKGQLCKAVETVWKKEKTDDFCYPLVKSNLIHHCEVGEICQCVDETLHVSQLITESDEIKWYSSVADMKCLSSMVPDVLLTLRVKAEGDTDYWKVYFFNGKAFIAQGKVTIVYDA